MNKHNEIQASHFSKKTLCALTKKGITIVGASWLPGRDGSFASADACTGYHLNDNGTGKVKTFLEVLACA